MDNSTYVALSQMTALERQLDVTANNLANANSNGFKSERVLFESYLHQNERDDLGEGTNFVLDSGSYVDARQGALTRTDNPLDVAISGKGWFAYQSDTGQTAYGRDGNFVLDDQGRMMTLSGAQVLDAGGAPITLPPDVAGSLSIASDGTMSSDAIDRDPATSGGRVIGAPPASRTCAPLNVIIRPWSSRTKLPSRP